MVLNWIARKNWDWKRKDRLNFFFFLKERYSTSLKQVEWVGCWVNSSAEMPLYILPAKSSLAKEMEFLELLFTHKESKFRNTVSAHYLCG